MKSMLIALVALASLAGCAHDNHLAKSQADATAAQAQARVAEANARAEEAKAVQALAPKVDAGGAAAYLIAKAVTGRSEPGADVRQQAPAQPQSVLGLAWQSVLQVADFALRGYGIRANRDVAIVSSNNNRDVSLGSYSAFAAMGNSIASAGTAGYAYVQAPQPNITQTLSGTGVLGSGSYTGPVTTTTTTTRNCPAGTAGNGGGTTTGGAGGSAPGGTC